MSARSKFLVFCFFLFTGLGVAVGIGQGVGAGLRSFAIGFGFWLIISFTRSDRFAQLRAGEQQDERQQAIGTEAMAVAGLAAVPVALIGAAIEMARSDPGPFTLMCVVLGAAFLLASLLLPRWR